MHSSFGTATSPNAAFRPSLPSPLNRSRGYTSTFVGSNAPGRVRLGGGGGSAAARAKNASMKFVPAPAGDFSGAGDAGMNAKVEEGAGSTTPPSLSTQIPHEPSAQSSKSADACASPRCLRHPGHAQSVPQQHSGAASAVIALSGGMGGNAGGAVELVEG